MSAPVMDRTTTIQTHPERPSTTSSSAPFIAALVVIALAAGALVYFHAHQKLGMPGVKVVDVPLLDTKGNPATKQSVPVPENIPGFHSEPIPMDQVTLNALPRDTIFGRRLYTTEDGFRGSGSVVLMGSDRTSIHKPEFCLPGSGWRIEKKETDNIKIADPQPYNLPVMKWTVEQQVRDANGQPAIVRGLYVFWFVNDHEITREHSGRMISIAKSMFTKGELERWAYASYLVMCVPGQEDATYERLKTLIAASVPQFQLVSGPSAVSK